MVKIYFLLMLHVHCRLAAGPLCVVFILGWGWWRKLYGTRSLWSQREKQRSWGSTYRLLKLPPGSYTSHFCSHFIVQSMQMAQSDIHEAWCVILPRWGGAGVGKVTGQQYSRPSHCLLLFVFFSLGSLEFSSLLNSVLRARHNPHVYAAWLT